MGAIGKIWNERKFEHLTGTDQIFEFKVDADRVLCFFVMGQRLILTHGFRKLGTRRPDARSNGLRPISESLHREVDDEWDNKADRERVA